jgi:hypothetical protein
VPQGSENVVAVPQGSENVVVVPEQMGHVVNPFWSETQQREVVREAFGPGYGVSALGLQPGSNASTPQKVHVGQRGNVDVEMDPVELFRLRCLREAEEKFRQGLLNMGTSAREPRLKNMGLKKGRMVHRVHMLLQWISKSLACPNLMMWLNPERFLSQM